MRSLGDYPYLLRFGCKTPSQLNQRFQPLSANCAIPFLRKNGIFYSKNGIPIRKPGWKTHFTLTYSVFT
jgi:hypothetical protein